jgi:hypothetical protein
VSNTTTAADADLLARLQQSAAALVGRPRAKLQIEALAAAMAQAAARWDREQQARTQTEQAIEDAALIAARLAEQIAPSDPPPYRARGPPEPQPIWLRPKDAARAAGVSRALIYQWLAADGRLVTRKVGGCRLILAASLAALEDFPGRRNGRPRRKLKEG